MQSTACECQKTKLVRFIRYTHFILFFYHKVQITIKQDSYTKANECGEEARKGTMRLIDIGLPQSKNKVNSNSKARIEK